MLLYFDIFVVSLWIPEKQGNPEDYGDVALPTFNVDEGHNWQGSADESEDGEHEVDRSTLLIVEGGDADLRCLYFEFAKFICLRIC